MAEGIDFPEGGCARSSLSFLLALTLTSIHGE